MPPAAPGRPPWRSAPRRPRGTGQRAAAGGPRRPDLAGGPRRRNRRPASGPASGWRRAGRRRRSGCRRRSPGRCGGRSRRGQSGRPGLRRRAAPRRNAAIPAGRQEVAGPLRIRAATMPERASSRLGGSQPGRSSASGSARCQHPASEVLAVQVGGRRQQGLDLRGRRSARQPGAAEPAPRSSRAEPHTRSSPRRSHAGCGSVGAKAAKSKPAAASTAVRRAPARVWGRGRPPVGAGRRAERAAAPEEEHVERLDPEADSRPLDRRHQSLPLRQERRRLAQRDEVGEDRLVGPILPLRCIGVAVVPQQGRRLGGSIRRSRSSARPARRRTSASTAASGQACSAGNSARRV